MTFEHCEKILYIDVSNNKTNFIFISYYWPFLMFFFPFAMQKKNFNFIKLFVSELRMYSTTRYVDKAIQIIKESRKKVSFEI